VSNEGCCFYFYVKCWLVLIIILLLNSGMNSIWRRNWIYQFITFFRICCRTTLRKSSIQLHDFTAKLNSRVFSPKCWPEAWRPSLSVQARAFSGHIRGLVVHCFCLYYAGGLLRAAAPRNVNFCLFRCNSVDMPT